MTHSDLLMELTTRVRPFRFVAEAARDLKVSQQLLEATLAGRRRIGPRLARGLGYRPVHRWEPIARPRRAARKRRR